MLVSYLLLGLALEKLTDVPTCIVNRSHDEDQQSQPSQGESNLGDGSGPLFSMYSKAADEKDKEMVERWKQEADGIILFVSYVSAFSNLCIIWNTIDWLILCCSRCAPFRLSPEPDPQQPGHLFILSWEHLWDSRRPECNTRIHLSPCRSTTTVLSSEICRLG
jgi:hypothetical protein